MFTGSNYPKINGLNFEKNFTAREVHLIVNCKLEEDDCLMYRYDSLARNLWAVGFCPAYGISGLPG